MNLLIAMLTDTYQEIEEESDKEWKFGRAKLIRNMQKTVRSSSTSTNVLCCNECSPTMCCNECHLFLKRDSAILHSTAQIPSPPPFILLAQLLALLAAYAHQARRGHLCFGSLALIRAVYRSDGSSNSNTGFAAANGASSATDSSTAFAKLKRPSKVSPEGTSTRDSLSRIFVALCL